MAAALDPLLLVIPAHARRRRFQRRAAFRLEPFERRFQFGLRQFERRDAFGLQPVELVRVVEHGVVAARFDVGENLRDRALDGFVLARLEREHRVQRRVKTVGAGIEFANLDRHAGIRFVLRAAA